MNFNHANNTVADWEALTASLLTYQPQSWKGSEKTNSDIYTDVLTPISRQKAGSHWRSVNYFWDQYQTGLNYARQGKLSSAEQVFAQATIARSEFTNRAMLNQLIDVSALPAVAYLCYKQGNYAEAERLLIKSIDSDAELVAEGMYILAFHRVQQLHNLARLLFRQGRLKEGACMIDMALKFLVYQQVPAIGNGKRWSDELTYQTSGQLRSDMLWQLTNETVNVFLTYPAQSIELCQLTFGNMTGWDAKTTHETEIQAWFTLIDLIQLSHGETRLSDIVNFLITSPPIFDNLKMVLVLIITQNSGVAARWQQRIFHFIAQLKLGPVQYKTCSTFVAQLLHNDF